ncbi:hypothetical protein ACFFRR_006054 [Megaselia abdita]
MGISLVLLCVFSVGSCALQANQDVISNVTEGLTAIVKALEPPQLIILTKICQGSKGETFCHGSKDFSDFIGLINENGIMNVIFTDEGDYLKYVEKNVNGSIKIASLIFKEPYFLSWVLFDKKLAHRVSLFMFYYGQIGEPQGRKICLREPLRLAVITKRVPLNVLRVYYNVDINVIPNKYDYGDENDDDGNDPCYGASNINYGRRLKLRMVNWYNPERKSVHNAPLIPSSDSVYSNLNNHVLRVPAFHAPPWFILRNTTNRAKKTDESDIITSKITGGRDHRLLEIIADKMNFQFDYVPPDEEIQGTFAENETEFTGGLGMVQSGKADFFLGDVSLSFERKQAVEFTFFTLADSGSFVTHAPRRLNEAFVVLRPFRIDVWPYVIFTVIVSGPMLYFIITIPKMFNRIPRDIEIYPEYISEITGYGRNKKILVIVKEEPLPKDLFNKCIWFTLQLFLKQSCSEPYHGYRARFLVIVYWIAATYVLAYVYAAQLTSQFAKPAKEPAIKSLYRLEHVMRYEKYKLYVENGSLSHEMLEKSNTSDVLVKIYSLMQNQPGPKDNKYFVDSTKSGLDLIVRGTDKEVVIAGRETLLYNIRKFGIHNFQISDKLFTRYSAIAVQIGCPYIERLNSIIMRLFEGGILDKITNDEYDKLSLTSEEQVSTHELNNEVKPKHESQSLQEISSLNLRMLQGAFLLLLTGYVLSILTLFCEICLANHKSAIISFWIALRLKISRTFINFIIYMFNTCMELFVYRK